jgi:peptidoglycan/xylan/chitin deacetylase (PgdA/CDA1 family)
MRFAPRVALRRQDLSVLLFHLLGYSKVRNHILRLQRVTASRFVTFHDLPPTFAGRFEANLCFLKEHANVVSLDDFFQGRLTTEKINVVITFDDGYKSWVSDAAPILIKLKLPATFFVASGFVGISNEEAIAFMRSKLRLLPEQSATTRGLTRDDLRRLADEGFTIGGHTLNHCNLADLHDSDRLTYEIAEDKRRLEAITGATIDYFAYPFGAYQHRGIDLTELVRISGYRGAVTTVSGFNTTRTNPYLLHRELTPASTLEWVFRARAFGNYDAVQLLKRWIDRIDIRSLERRA